MRIIYTLDMVKLIISSGATVSFRRNMAVLPPFHAYTSKFPIGSPVPQMGVALPAA